MNQNQINGLTQMIISILMILILVKMLMKDKMVCKPIYQNNIEVLECQYK